MCSFKLKNAPKPVLVELRGWEGKHPIFVTIDAFGVFISAPFAPRFLTRNDLWLFCASSLIHMDEMPMYTVGHKKVPLNFCPYLRQILTDFKNSFTINYVAPFYGPP